MTNSFKAVKFDRYFLYQSEGGGGREEGETTRQKGRERESGEGLREEVAKAKRARLLRLHTLSTLAVVVRRRCSFLSAHSLRSLSLCSSWPAPASLRSREEAEAAAQRWLRESNSERTATLLLLLLLL